jgi:Zn-dependent peptidase ImmA (M78 family)
LPNLKSRSGDLAHDEIAEALLEEAGALSGVPTRELDLLDYLGLKQLSFNFGEEPTFIQLAPEIPKQLRAALSVNDRLVVTHSELGPKRNRWSVFHEIAHFVLPEHLEKIFLDDDRSLSIWTRIRLEREANSLAAELVFQGSRFTEESFDLPLSCQTVLDLAPRFEASYESATRRYVERHVLPCAVIVYERVPALSGEEIEDEKYRIHYTVTSRPFKRKYFAAVETDSELTRGSDIFKVHGSANIGNVIRSELKVEKHHGGAWVFDSELFTNSYKIFQFIFGEAK